MEQRSRRILSTGLDAIGSIKAPERNLDPTRNDQVSAGFELVGTPAILALLGHLLDRTFGTSPLFALAFAVVGFATVLGLVIWRYNNEMVATDAARRDAQHERGYGPARWERRS